jgi:hypothetical protein
MLKHVLKLHGTPKTIHCQKTWLGWLHLSLYWMRASNSNSGARHRVNC